MAAKKADEGPEDVIDAGAAQGGTTATGQEAARRAGTEDERLDNLDSRGGPESEDKILPDNPAKAAPKPIGAQAEDAQFVANGSVPINHVASNSGLVPVSAIAATPEDAEKRLDEHRTNLSDSLKSRRASRTRVDDATIDKMSGAELRAVGTDRGYGLSDSAGTRGTRAAFKRAQDEDEYLDEAK